MTPTRALTLWPEWAWAIHHLDKRVENRTWKIPMGEWFGLHAGKCIGGSPRNGWGGMDGLMQMARRAEWELVDVGALNLDVSIVRQAQRQVDVWAHHMLTSSLLGAFRVVRHDAPGCGDLTGWRVPDQVGNVFEYRPLVRPVACKGAQGLWTIPADVRERMEASDV